MTYATDRPLSKSPLPTVDNYCKVLTRAFFWILALAVCSGSAGWIGGSSARISWLILSGAVLASLSDISVVARLCICFLLTTISMLTDEPIALVCCSFIVITLLSYLPCGHSTLRFIGFVRYPSLAAILFVYGLQFTPSIANWLLNVFNPNAFLNLLYNGVVPNYGYTYFGTFYLLIFFSIIVTLKASLRFKLGMLAGIIAAWTILINLLAALSPYIIMVLLRYLSIDITQSQYYDLNFPTLLSFLPILLFSSFGFGLLAFLWKNTRDQAKEFKKGYLRHTRRRAILCGVMAISILMPICFEALPSALSKAPTIGIWNRGLVDFSVPDYNKFGTGQTGMFGLFRALLEQMGANVEDLKGLPDRESLKAIKCVIVINPQELTENECIGLIAYVSAGGQLLVLGDHTNLMETGISLNRLLNGLGLTFRFDSAFTINHSWKYVCRSSWGKIGPLLDCENVTLEHSTGASLECTPVWKPLVMASHAFSDLGNRLNPPGYLGNYQYEYGERLGDLCIVAQRKYGNGTIVVFGDTSGFQNIAIAHSEEFITPMMKTILSGPNTSLFIGLEYQIFTLAAVLLAVTWGGQELAFGFILFCSVILDAAISDKNTNGATDIIYVDSGHCNKYTLEHWRANSIDGLLLNLYRAKFHPRLTNTETAILEDAKEIIIVEPQSRLSSGLQRRLLKYAHGGGKLIISCGPSNQSNIDEIFKELDGAIGDAPLGAAPNNGKMAARDFMNAMSKPQFSLAWPILNLTGVVLYEWKGLPIVETKKYGAGRITIIADPAFLLDKTLESEEEAWPGNIYFLKKLLTYSSP